MQSCGQLHELEGQLQHSTVACLDCNRSRWMPWSGRLPSCARRRGGWPRCGCQAPGRCCPRWAWTAGRMRAWAPRSASDIHVVLCLSDCLFNAPFCGCRAPGMGCPRCTWTAGRTSSTGRHSCCVSGVVALRGCPRYRATVPSRFHPEYRVPGICAAGEGRRRSGSRRATLERSRRQQRRWPHGGGVRQAAGGGVTGVQISRTHFRCPASRAWSDDTNIFWHSRVDRPKSGCRPAAQAHQPHPS